MSDTAIIDVTFVDAETGEPFMALKVPLRQLPEHDTALTIGKDDWLVVDVTPARAEEIVKAGKASLVLRKVQYVDPKTILFSLPTVADVIPEEAEPGDLVGALVMHEDDWLQLELMPVERVKQATADLDAVRAVLTQERQGSGFKQLHVRKAVPAPFEGHPLTLAKLKALFGSTTQRVGYRSTTTALKGCFAFRLTSGAWLYGQEAGGNIAALGLSTREPEALQRMPGLALIDWCAAEVVRSDAKSD
jgi:hypothetical protein